MRTGRPKAELVLTAEEERELKSLAHRSRSAAMSARRARAVLASAAGADKEVGKWTPSVGQRGSDFKVDSTVHYAAEGTVVIPS